MAPVDSHTLPAGHRLFGAWEIVEPVHVGVAAIRYAAHRNGVPAYVDEYFPARLAARSGDVDVTPASDAAHGEFMAGLTGFLASARTLMAIDEAGIAGVQASDAAHGTGYVVTAAPGGRPLTEVLAGGRMLSPPQVAQLLRPVVRGLVSVHAAGIVHRQVSPDAIVVGDDSAAVLGGFGYGSKAAGGARRGFEARATRLVDIAPGYAALEQYTAAGREGPWTDIYALGAVAYRCLTGRPPPDAPHRAVSDDLARVGTGSTDDGDARVLAAVDAALAVPIASRPQSLATWQAMLFGDAERAVAANRAGRTSARGFGRVSAPAGAPGEPAPAPAVTDGTLLRRALRWGVPAAAATGLMAVMTWVDTGVLRDAEADGPDARDASRGTAPRRAPVGAGEFADALRSGGTGPVMVRIGPGTMRVPCWPPGCVAEPGADPASVVVGEAFGLSRYEVTQGDFARFARATGRVGTAPAAGRDVWQPVVNVSWDDAVAYAVWLSAETGREYRLPTEGEWQYAARAGGGAQAMEADGQAPPGTAGASPVGEGVGNAWGLHDMTGNVSEWVHDCAAAGAPSTPGADCERRIRRGSSWVQPPPNAGTASRATVAAGVRDLVGGFRVASGASGPPGG